MFDDGIYVKHKKEGYEGVIDGQTSLKDFFTGNREVAVQYRIRVPRTEVRHVAPEEDLEAIDPKTSPNAGSLIALTATNTKFKEESFLAKAGYNFSMDMGARRDILKKVVGETSLLRVVSFMMRSLIFNRTGSRKRVSQNIKCLDVWATDVDWLVKNFKEEKDFPAVQRLFQREKSVLARREFVWDKA